MELFVQFVAALAIVGLGFLSLKYRPKIIETKTLVLVTLLICIAIILQYFSIMIPLFGANSFKISFEQLPVIFIGVLFGPFWGFIGAFLTDVLSFMINPQGFYFVGFLLSRILVALIPALWFSEKVKLGSNMMLRTAQVAIVILFAGACIYILTTDSIILSKEVYVLDARIKWGISLVCLALSSFLVVMIERMTRYPDAEISDFAGRFTLTVLTIELFVQMTLTPMWLYTMYHIPYLLNFFIRVLSGSLMVPLKIFIGISLYRIVFIKLFKSKKRETV